ncbi:RING/U-box superfamily protein [Wolffia australiana]
MADLRQSDGGISDNCDGEEDFRSCCAEEDAWKESEELLDELSMKLFFKGVSICDAQDLGVSGIGVVMERSRGLPPVQVQKRLDLYVEPLIADHLALLDGLLEAQRVGARRIFAFTDSEVLNRLVSGNGSTEDQFLFALGRRIMEHADKLESFSLHLVPASDLEKPLQLAEEAAGIFHPQSINDEQLAGEKNNLIIGDYFPESQSSIGINSVEIEANRLERISCPYASCSSWLIPPHYSENSCIECPDCARLVCFNCVSPWHASMTCREYQRVSQEGTADVSAATGSHAAPDGGSRCCQQCRRVIERTEGCYRMICWCGHEICYACGAEAPGCGCGRWGEEGAWRWDMFDEEALAGSAYTEQERSQIALIQSFLAGGFGFGFGFGFGSGSGFGLGERQSPPRCSDAYGEVVKEDLRHLPWLERFVSVISDSCFEDLGQ